MPFFHSCGAMTIKDYWRNQPDKHGWHQWKTAKNWPIDLPHPGSDRLAQYLAQQKIHASQGSDKLRWDLSTSGVFSVKEAYLLRAAVSIIPNTQVWKRIWTSHLWPKVAHFLWLVIHKRILTWDRLLKRGFIKPSTCFLFRQAEETQHHIFMDCPLIQQV